MLSCHHSKNIKTLKFGQLPSLDVASEEALWAGKLLFGMLGSHSVSSPWLIYVVWHSSAQQEHLTKHKSCPRSDSSQVRAPEGILPINLGFIYLYKVEMGKKHGLFEAFHT